MQWTVRDLASMFQVSESTVARWVTAEGLAASTVSGELRFNPTNVVAWAACHQAPILDSFVRALNSPRSQTASFAHLLERGGILQRVVASGKLELVAEVVEGLPLPEGFNRRALAEVLIARPSLGGQLYADGILAPLPRYPLIVPGASPAVTMFLLRSPLSLAEPRGPMVDTLFLILAPTVATHLSLVAQLKAALLDLDFRDLVKRRQSHDHIFRAAHRLQNLSLAGYDDPPVRSD